MLFSRENVATFINGNFEPVWQSVRPVPMVHIDFGNGTVLTRTLHGNIATYVCTAEGQVLDIVGGIYTPDVYLQRLAQFRLLAHYVDQEGKDKRAERLADYHKRQLEAMKKNEAADVLLNLADRGKRRIEGITKVVVMKGARQPDNARPPTAATASGLKTPDDLANWVFLIEDTKTNETVRRSQIHEKLSASGLVHPDRLTKWIYKDVLHADLDDPYLGLGSTLFTNYPFKDGNTPTR